MLAHDNVPRQWGSVFSNSGSDVDVSMPLFERERRHDGQFIQRLQNELSDAKRLLEAQTRRQSDLEYVNEDLERRLEHEARERIELEALREDDMRRWEAERKSYGEANNNMQKKYEEEMQRRVIMEERLRRAEKELYRMHQKKYDIEKSLRREENEKRRHEAHIIRGITDSKTQANSRVSSRNRSANSRIPFDSSQNPSDFRPKTIRNRQAVIAAMDFFGI